MHEFRTLLTKYLRENHWTQQRLAGQLDADQATVSRWLSGRVQMGGSTLEKLLALVPAGQKGLLLEAYLRDQIPQGTEHLVDLKAVGAAAEYVPWTAKLKPDNARIALAFGLGLASQTIVPAALAALRALLGHCGGGQGGGQGGAK